MSGLFLSEVAEHISTTLRKMLRLSESGPLGMRLFVQVVAHMAAAAVPHSVLQYLKAGQITPLAKPTGGHRPLLMMSFLRRLALKSVMAAKRESVAKCVGALEYGVGRPDGANTMIKTIPYLAEADTSQVLIALDLKAAFQNVFPFSPFLSLPSFPSLPFPPFLSLLSLLFSPCSSLLFLLSLFFSLCSSLLGLLSLFFSPCSSPVLLSFFLPFFLFFFFSSFFSLCATQVLRSVSGSSVVVSRSSLVSVSRATHSLLAEVSTGVLLTGTHP